jgi:glucose/arabinose dehydrogenase
MKSTLPLLFFISIFFMYCAPSSRSNAEKNNADSSRYYGVEAAEELPEPYATKSVVKTAKVIGWSEGIAPKAPAGFTVTKFADGLQNPRWIYVLPNGDVLVAETKKEEKPMEKIVSKISGRSKAHGESDVVNRISLFRDRNKDGIPEVHTEFLTGLNMPFGMLVLKDYFYVANTDALWRYPYKDGETSIKAAGERLLDLPPVGRHWTRNIIANKEGTKIYITVGSSTDHADNGYDKETRRACILEVNPDGSGERIYASGLRNPVGLAWSPGSGALWAAVNERDELGDDLPPDFITSIKEGGFYGWPFSYYGQHKDPRIKEEDQHNDLVQKAIVPDVPLGTHTASLGLAFYEASMFPVNYLNGAFVGQHGSWNRSVFSGYKVVFVPFNNGRIGKPQDFLTGFIADEPSGKVYGRPVGVTVAQDGSLLVADDAGNTVWRVSYKR